MLSVCVRIEDYLSFNKTGPRKLVFSSESNFQNNVAGVESGKLYSDEGT